MLRRGFPRMLRALIWPLAFAAMDDAGPAAFGAWPHVKSVSDVAATAIVTDHAWPQNLDSVDGYERITMKGLRSSERRRLPKPDQSSETSQDKRRTQPHERGLSVPKEPTLLGDLKAD
jgi:hypothetical protein